MLLAERKAVPAVRGVLAVLLGAMLLWLVVAPARATALPGPASFSLGLVDDPMFQFAPPATAARWLQRARALGSKYVRVDAFWPNLAPMAPTDGTNPRDPSYDFTDLDVEIRRIASHGLSPVLMIRGAPPWAEAADMPAILGGDDLWKPNAAAFGRLAQALATRYSGQFRDPLHPGRMLPRVRFFQAWNEPNLPTYLMPQWIRNDSNSPWQAASPVIYRNLLNHFYAGVKAVQPDATVLSAGTAPYGDPPGSALGRMSPVTFYRDMFCLNAPCAHPPHLDVLDHHPYSLTASSHARIPGNVSIADLGKLWSILRQAQRRHDVLPAGPKAMWTTEVGWTDIKPDDSALQVNLLVNGFYELWREGVSVAFWFDLRDPLGHHNTFSGVGLYKFSGVAKPAAAAYRFPFVAVPAANGAMQLWGLAPKPGSVKIQKRARRRWVTMATLTSTQSGVFYAQRNLSGHPSLRAVAGRWVSPVYVP